MNEKESIIFLRGIDRTAEIKSIKNLGTSYRVSFHRLEETMSYHPNEFRAESVVSYMDQCDGVLILVDGQVVEASRLYQSQNYCKVIDGETRNLFPLRQVKLIPCKRKIKNLKAKLIYLADFPVGEVEALYDFGEHYRIVHKDGTRVLCPAVLIHIDVKRPLTDEMNYFAKVASLQDDGRSGSPSNLLRTQYEQLNYINSDSVLNSYLKQMAPTQIKSNLALIYPFSFDLSLKQAIEKVFESKISLIESPPGTGKEEAILNIIVNAVMQNKTVAVLSNSNAGLKSLQERLHEENYSFFTATVGNDTFFYNQPDYPADLSGWKQTEAERKKLLTEINQYRKEALRLLEVQREKAILKRELADLIKEKEYFDHYLETNNLNDDVESFGFLNKMSNDSLISFLADNAMQLSRGRTLSFISKVKLIIKYGFSNFDALDEKNFEVMIHLQRRYYDAKIERLKKNIYRLEKKLLTKDFSRKILTASEKSKILFQAELYEHYKERMEIRPVFDKDTYDQVFFSFMKEYPVVFCSPDSLRGSIPQDYLFDYIILDDASQIDLASASLALSCSRNAVVLGDIRQQPLVVNANDRARIEEVLHQYTVSDEFNYNRHSILSSMDKLFRRSIARTVLREHYRCHPQIIEFCNQKYYNGDLIPVSEEDSEVQPLILLNTISAKHVRMIPKEIYENDQVRAMEAITEDLLIRGSLPQDRIDLIGYETPFRKRSLKSDGKYGGIVEPDIASKYQVKEKDIIIFSAVLDLPRQVGDSSWSFVDDPRQVNVTVSQAKHQLVLVITDSFQKTQGSSVGDLIRYAEYQTVAENLLCHELIPVFDLVYREYTGSLMLLKSKMKYSARYRAAFLMNGIIEMMLREQQFGSFSYAHGVPLRILIRNWDKLTEEERAYAKSPSTCVDFVIYNRYDKLPVLAIEVGGIAYKGKKALHLIRDDMKERILEKYKLDLLWISINEGWEGDILRNKLEEILTVNEDLSENES
jgi:superfamily I DNA and/or RNA helicase